MREGLQFLWLLALAASAAAWLYRKRMLTQKKEILNRSQIRGYELARQILDRHHFSRSAVQVLPSGKNQISNHREQLFLKEKIYHGTSLNGLAEALHETGHFLLASKKILPVKLDGTAGRFFRSWIFLSWVLVGAGILIPRWPWILAAGQLLFILAFFVGLGSLADEWEMGQKGLAELAFADRLGVDERIHMKEVLKALRWTPLADTLEIPLRTLGGFFIRPRGETQKAGLTI